MGEHMIEPGKISALPSLPGVRRDGTVTDSDFYNAAQWVRFIRADKGRPRKMGGYQLSTDLLAGIPRGVLVWSHQFTNRIVVFSEVGVQYVDVDTNGLGGNVTDITPAGYTDNPATLWSFDVLFDAAGGSNGTVLLCTPMQTMTNMDDPTLNKVYYTVLGTNPVAQLTQIADVNALAPGGLFCTPPYSVLLGNDGNVTWSDANLPQNYGGAGSNPGGDQGTARVTGSKLVKGLPMRSGSGPGGMLWSLDSVIRMDFIGGSAIFRFSQICSGESSLLSQNAVIQYNGNWYWAGINKFFISNGSQVSELPNDLNKNWFYDNLNRAYRQKVWVLRMPRWGEIWWFFPFGDSTECNYAVIFNANLNTWYDVKLSRSSGTTPSVLDHPVMTTSNPGTSVNLTYTVSAGTVAVGDYVQGNVSGAIGAVQLISGAGPFVAQVIVTNGTFTGEAFHDTTSGATGTITAVQSLYALYLHENGQDHTGKNPDHSDAIPAWFETCNFGLPTGGTQVAATEGVDLQTNLVRIEPDFVMQGDMTLNVITREFAQSPDVVSTDYPFDGNTGKIDVHLQGREMRLKFTSNTQGGFFETGAVLMNLEPGDVRP